MYEDFCQIFDEFAQTPRFEAKEAQKPDPPRCKIISNANPRTRKTMKDKAMKAMSGSPKGL